MIEGDALTELEVNSDWEAEAGPGCELTVHLASGRRLFVIRTGIESTKHEVETWRNQHLGERVEETREIARWPLGTGGEQVTLDITLTTGFTFEGDLIVGGPDEMDEAELADEEELETEWVFEGTPGEEMGRQGGTQHR